MRTGATQHTPTSEPVVKVTVDGDVYTTRIRRTYADEQVWGGNYPIELDNSDKALNTKDYKGKSLTLNHGFSGEAGSDLAPLWVHSQELVSRGGELRLRLNCIDAWGLLAAVNVTAGAECWNYDWQSTAELAEAKMPDGSDIPTTLKTQIAAQYDKTALQIITSVISNAIGKSVVLDDNDGIINVIKPQLAFTNARSGVKAALEGTKSFLLWKGDGKFHVVQPDAHGSAYSYDPGNRFFSNVTEAAITIPNRVIYYGMDSGGLIISGSAVDSVSYGRLGMYIDRHYQTSRTELIRVFTVSELNALASGTLTKIQGERSQGMLIAPMNCAQELFDKITVVDTRYGSPGKTTTGYVHRIIREREEGVYRITLVLGGVTTGFTPGGGGIPLPLAYYEAPTIEPTERRIPEAIQGYYHNITFTAVDYNTVSWTSGAIKFYDGTIQNISSGSKNLISSVPYYIYFDLDSGSPNVLKTTVSYLSVMTLRTGVVCLVQRGSDSSVKALVIPSFGKEPLITADVIYLTGLLDKLPDGTYGKVLSTSITAGRILIDELYTSGETYGLVKQTDISAGHIILSSVVQSSSYRTVTDGQKGTWDGKPDNMDEIGEGATYQRVRATDISAGHLKLTSAVVVAGEWYNESGIEIDATHGINIYGVNNALTTRATKTGTIQCYVGADGKIYAGAGNVYLDAAGITVVGANLRVKDGAYSSVVRQTGQDLILIPYRNVICSVGDLLASATYQDFGSTSVYWENGYIKHVRPPTTGGVIFKTTHTNEEGSIKIKGGGSGDIYIYSSGAWRTNT